jgi:uncharacterized protein with GYD domain
MTTYLLFGNYSLEGVRGISVARTQQAMSLIKELGGAYKGGYAMLGGIDVLLIIELPDMEAAVKASTGLSALLGISFNTSPAVSMEEFDRLMDL